MKLNDLRDNPGARKSRVRVGRGIGSGVGKTGGRGQKGQKSRSGVSIHGFEGGQMPLHMRIPKRGFNNVHAKDYAEVNLGAIQKMVDSGALVVGGTIDHAALKAAGLARGGKDDAKEVAFRSAVIRLKQQKNLFQEHDDGVSFIGRSLFRATVDLPVNVPVGRYTANVYLFRDGKLLGTNHSTLEVSKAAFERVIYLLALKRPFLYGLSAVAIAVLVGLLGWMVFRRE